MDRMLSDNASWAEIKDFIDTKGETRSTISLARAAAWIAFANIALFLTMAAISGGDFGLIFAILIGINLVGPFIRLMLCKWLVKRSHPMRQLDPNSAEPEEASLCAIVKSLADRAGLPETPEVWLYDSPDMNAFTTGPNKSSAMIAFSTSLLAKMDNRSVAAVAAHEIGHIANGDMFIMTVVESIVNIIAEIISFPLQAITFMFACDDTIVGFIMAILCSIASFIFSTVVFFLGSLVVKAFSRQREFKADAFAAKLVDGDSMAHALSSLRGDTIRIPKRQAAYNTLKISNNAFAGGGIMDIFSTHPSLDRRIERLSTLQFEPVPQKGDVPLLPRIEEPQPIFQDQPTNIQQQAAVQRSFTEAPAFNTGAAVDEFVLHCLDGMYQGIDIPLTGEPIIIGRDPQSASLIIDSPDVSRRHASVSLSDDGAIMVEDLHSSNGTFMLTGRGGKEKIAGSVRLHTNDMFCVGVKQNRFMIKNNKVK